MRLTLALFAMAALLPEGVAAQSASDRAALDSVDRYVRAELERQRIPGMSVAVLRGDSILLARGYGFASLEHRVPATDSTIYLPSVVMALVILVLLLRPAGLFVRGRTSVVDRV